MGNKRVINISMHLRSFHPSYGIIMTMGRIITGITAHVDAGKTTLSEALLLASGAIRKAGRVDDGNAFLDTEKIEKRRGITIYAKEAILSDKVTLIDTPGHVDFTSEMERTLSVLDAAVLVISAPDGIQAHTRTLWHLLKEACVPVLIFANKMDMAGADRDALKQELKKGLSENIADFTSIDMEEIASCDDDLTEKYLSGENISDDDIRRVIREIKLFPLLFGSALKFQGTEEVLSVLENYFTPAHSSDDFGATVYRISRDRKGNRLTHMKITGGVLHARDELGGEKANEVRLFSGEKYESVREVPAGEVCTVTGLKNSFPGCTYGSAKAKHIPLIEAPLIYTVTSEDVNDTSKLLMMMREISDEMPELKVTLSEKGDVTLSLMGEVQTEVITETVKDRYGVTLSFSDGRIAYRETIKSPVTGMGHYEPLKHYAEVHLRLKPLPRGTGLVFRSELSVDVLDTNWQRLILTHLAEKQHKGVLTGSPITDIMIEVSAGRAHLKHTEGGDFRQATYRAVRHALMRAENILLEPYYSYTATVPEECAGRFMSDMERLKAECTIADNRSGIMTLSGRGPVSTMMNYAVTLRSYTKGEGVMALTPDGYEECHDSDRVIAEAGYDAEADKENPASSVFCSHGAGYTVPWQEAEAHMHIRP